MRSARFGAGAGQALTAKGLDADNGADLVPVHIDIADARAPGDTLHRFVDAGVDAHGETVAKAVDLVNEHVEFVGAVAHYMEDGAEDFPFQFGQFVNFEGGRADECSVDAMFCFRRCRDQFCFEFDVIHIVLNIGSRFFVDDGPHIGVQFRRIADSELSHGAGEHFIKTVSDVFLNANDAAG